MSEETKQQNICSAVFSSSRINLLEDGGKTESSITHLTKVYFLYKVFLKYYKILNLKLELRFT